MGKSSYEELEKELKELKNSDIRPLKEDHYENFFDNMSEMVEVIELIYDKNNQPIDFYIRAINTSFANFLGKTKKQLVNKKVSSVVDKIEENWFTSFAKVDKTGKPLRFKNYGAAFDKYYFVSVWKVSKKNIGISFTDITKSERIELELKKKLEKEKKENKKAQKILEEKKLEIHNSIKNLEIASTKLIFQGKEKDKQANELALTKLALEQQITCLNNAAIVSETNADGDITFVNDQFCELYGYRREELIGKNHRILKSGKQPDAFFTHLTSTLSSGKIYNNIILNKKKGGKKFYWMDITIMPFKDLNGKIIKFVGIMFNVTSQIEQKEILLDQSKKLAFVNKKLATQNKDKDKRADDLISANTELAFQNEEKEKQANELIIADLELVFQNKEKGKRADELAIANKELAFQNEEKEKRAEELAIANKELAFQNEEKEKRAEELAVANKELAFQNEEKEKRAEELAVANKELAFQNEEKEKRAEELVLANTELAFQNEEKEKRAEELVLANTELAFQNEEKEKRAEELAVANKELAFQNEEKEKRAEELVLANTELAFQNKEKEKRAEELVLANTELAFQNDEKEKRAEELAVANTELAFQNKEKDKRADELVIANKELKFQNKEKVKRADELARAKKELAFQKELDTYRAEMERVALELTLLIDTANAPIFGIDSEGLVNEWNQTSEKITGFKKDEVLGKELVQTYITKSYRKSVKKVLDDALLGKETANYEFPLFAKNGQRVMVLLNSSTRRDGNGKITGVLGVGQDITELVGYRNELELKVDERTLKLNRALKKEKELSELKSRFVSTASHEFRTPLSAINFAAGSIKKYWARMESDQVEKKLDKIEDQVIHMTKLLDDILIVGQADAGEFRNNPTSLNLGNFINEIIDEVYDSWNKSHKISLIDIEKLENDSILIDEKLGRNIFINLISNAVKFSPQAKKVIVELSTEKNYIVISITDFGIGISKSELKNIFIPFSRGKNVDLIQGTGLGLSIAKEAIKAIKGKIIVNSNLGQGTTFIVKIPKAK